MIMTALKGAKFTLPASDNVVTHTSGRGASALINSASDKSDGPAPLTSVVD